MAKWNIISEKEIDLIKSGNHNSHDLSVLLKRNQETINRIAREYGISLPRRVLRKYPINENLFGEWNENTSYWLGFISADGCILENKKKEPAILNIALSIKDELHLSKFRDLICKDLLLKKKEKYKSVYLNVCSKYLCNDLVNLGITPRKSLTLKWIKKIPDQYIRHFIRGYFDGDGYIRLKIDKKYGYRNLEFSILGTEDFLNGIKNEFSKIYGKKVGSLKSCKKWYNAYRLTFSTRSALHFGNWVYNNSVVRLDRKYNIYKNFIEDANLPSLPS